MDTDIAGEGQEAPVVVVTGYQAMLGKRKSPKFGTREEARDWIASERVRTGDHDSGSRLDELYETKG